MTLGGKIASFWRLKTRVFSFRHLVSHFPSFWLRSLSFLKWETQLSVFLWSTSFSFPLWYLAGSFGPRYFSFFLFIFSDDLRLFETFGISSECGFPFPRSSVFSSTGSISCPIESLRCVSEKVWILIKNRSFVNYFDGVIVVFWLPDVSPSSSSAELVRTRFASV